MLKPIVVKSVAVGSIWSAIFLLVLASRLFSAPLERSLSTSRQFIPYGTNVRLRGAISDVAEKTKADLLRLLQQRDGWKTPIVVNLQFPQANLPDIPAAQLHVSQTGFGLKLQLDLTLSDTADAPAIKRELLRAILLEIIYRNLPETAAGTVFVQPPDWLLDGLLAIAPGQERRPLLDALLPLVNSNKTLSLAEFLRQKPTNLDSPGRWLYRGYALALLQFIIDQPGGRLQLAGHIANLSRASNDPLADLRARFPALNSSDFEAVWKAHVRRFAGADNRFQLLTFTETDRRLDELLRVRVPEGARSGEQKQWPDLVPAKPSPAQARVLQAVSQNLTLLAASANPVMRPIVLEYQDIAQLLARGKRARLAERLTRINATRKKLVARMNDIDDYLNWFEATQLNSNSGVFADYFKAAGESAEPKRRDALSVYLDAIEQQIQE
jgi:hypothetical protein